MTFDTWQAIANRHVRFRAVLIARMELWPDARIEACKDLAVLRQIVRLAERAERHDERMNRHLERGLAHIKSPSNGRH